MKPSLYPLYRLFRKVGNLFLDEKTIYNRQFMAERYFFITVKRLKIT